MLYPSWDRTCGWMDPGDEPRDDTTKPSLPLDLEDLIGARAFGRRHLGGVVLRLADERPRDGRRDRDLAVLHARLEVADDLVLDLLVCILVDQRHRRAE